jgi:hypothetical protein
MLRVNNFDNNYRITNKLARKITGIHDTIKMSRYFKTWTEKGLLQKIDSGFKGLVYYKKVGVDIPKKIDSAFAGNVENGK